MSITDLVLSDLVDLDALQLIDLAQKLLNVAQQKIEEGDKTYGEE